MRFEVFPSGASIAGVVYMSMVVIFDSLDTVIDPDLCSQKVQEMQDQSAKMMILREIQIE